MELSYKLLTSPNLIHTESSKSSAKKPSPNRDVPRRIDMYFISAKRSKSKYASDWTSMTPEDFLAERYEELANPEISIFEAADFPYYLHGICYKLFDMPTDTMNRRRCIELRIDGKNVVIEADEKKLFVVDYHKGIRYELGSSFKSKITTKKKR